MVHKHTLSKRGGSQKRREREKRARARVAEEKNKEEGGMDKDPCKPEIIVFDNQSCNWAEENPIVFLDQNLTWADEIEESDKLSGTPDNITKIFAPTPRVVSQETLNLTGERREDTKLSWRRRSPKKTNEKEKRGRVVTLGTYIPPLMKEYTLENVSSIPKEATCYNILNDLLKGGLKAHNSEATGLECAGNAISHITRRSKYCTKLELRQRLKSVGIGRSTFWDGDDIGVFLLEKRPFYIVEWGKAACAVDGYNTEHSMDPDVAVFINKDAHWYTCYATKEVETLRPHFFEKTERIFLTERDAVKSCEDVKNAIVRRFVRECFLEKNVQPTQEQANTFNEALNLKTASWMKNLEAIRQVAKSLGLELEGEICQEQEVDKKDSDDDSSSSSSENDDDEDKDEENRMRERNKMSTVIAKEVTKSIGDMSISKDINLVTCQVSTHTTSRVIFFERIKGLPNVSNKVTLSTLGIGKRMRKTLLTESKGQEWLNYDIIHELYEKKNSFAIYVRRSRSRIYDLYTLGVSKVAHLIDNSELFELGTSEENDYEILHHSLDNPFEFFELCKKTSVPKEIKRVTFESPEACPLEETNLISALRNSNWERTMPMVVGTSLQFEGNVREIGIENFKSEKDFSGWTFTFDLLNDTLDNWYIHKGTNKIHCRDEMDVRKLPHDLILLSLFKTRGDKRMDTLGAMGDNSDRTTPDVIDCPMKGRAWVLELKTTRDESSLAEKYEESINTYRNSLRQRQSSQLTIRQYGLSVSRDSICTNIPGNLNIATECCLHYRVGLFILDAMETAGLLTPLDEELEERINTIYKELTKFELPDESENELIITKELINKFKRPANVKKVFDMFKDSYHKASHIVKTKNYDEISKAVTFARSMMMCEKETDVRADRKAPVQLPFCYPTSTDKIELPLIPDGDDPLCRIWRSAFLYRNEHPENFKTHEDMQLGVTERVKENREADKTLRRKNKRVVVKLDTEEGLKLALSGVHAKQFRSNWQVSEKKKIDKLPFSWSVKTDDIDEFIRRNDLFEETGCVNKYSENCKDLIERAINITGDEHLRKISGQISEVLNLKVFLALTVIDEIAQEVNLSRKQNCNSKELILKKLTTVNGWILISPTNSAEHIFYSVLLDRSTVEAVDLPFKKSYSDGKVYLYPFLQLDADRIDQYLYAPLKCLSFLMRQLQLFGGHPNNILKTLSPQAKHHFLAETLFYLEDKRQTSTSVQQFRYGYMELINSNNMANPFKIFSKIDQNPRSRLLVWAVRNFYNASCKMIRDPPIVGREKLTIADESEDVAVGLISWVDFSPVPTFESAIELSYYCNLHNKSRKNITHDSFEILKKILEEDLKYKDTRKECVGQDSCRDPGPHEFDPDLTGFCAEVVRKDLTKQFDKYNNELKRKIVMKLAQVTFSDLGTTKSSAINIAERKTFELNKVDKRGKIIKEKESRKCLEAALEASRELDTNYPFTKLHTIVEKVKKQGGVLANLFPKEQIGGAREIFRLEFYSRIMMKFVETVALTIDELLPNALLSKGTKKMQRSHEHYFTLKGNLKRGVTSINSMDCKRWAQNFVMTSFACTFSKILPEDLIEPFCCALNQITSKKIEIPNEVCKMFVSRPDISSFTPAINTLKDEFLGNTKNNWFLTGPYSKMIINRTNMMQGQCHVVSDVHHACYMRGIEMMIRTMVTKYNEKGNKQTKVHITTKCTSDDSSQLITVYSKEFDNSLEMKASFTRLALILSNIFSIMYPFNCMKYSPEKSTIGNLNFVEEFNSVWLYRNTIIAAPIKHLYTAITTPCTSNFEMRCYEMQNLLMELFESSGSSTLCSYVQVLQAYTHYSLMGCLTNANFKMWSTVCFVKEHPLCGFFLLQPTSTAGIMPLEFSKYIACRNSSQSLDIENYLFQCDGVEYHSEYGRVCSMRISEGQEKKYKEFKKRMDVNEDLLNDYAKKNLWWLYRKPNTQEETDFALKLKSLSPGMADSMVAKKGHKIHTNSAYIYTEPCIAFKKKGGDPCKINFYNATQMIEPQIVPEESRRDTMELLFRNITTFEEVYQMSLKCKDYNITKRTKKRPIRIMISASEEDSYLSLKDTLVGVWTDQSRRNQAQIEYSWVMQRRNYPWLEKSLEGTLNNKVCPFENALSLMNFIKRSEKETLRVRSYCTGRVLASPLETLKNLIRNSAWSGLRYSAEKDDNVDYIDANLQLARSHICLTMDGPFTENQKIELTKKILKGIKTGIKHQTILTSDQEKLFLFSMCSKLKEGDDTNELSNRLLNSRLTVIGSWTKRSKVSESGTFKGEGIWTGIMTGTRVNVHTSGSMISHIRIFEEDLDKLRFSGNALMDLMSQLSIKVPEKNEQGNYYYDTKRKIYSSHKRTFSIPIKFSEQTLPNISVGNIKLIISIPRKTISISQKGRDSTINILSMHFTHFRPPMKMSVPECLNKVKTEIKWLYEPWYRGTNFNIDDFIKKSSFLSHTNEITDWFLNKTREELTYYKRSEIELKDEKLSNVSGVSGLIDHQEEEVNDVRKLLFDDNFFDDLGDIIEFKDELVTIEDFNDQADSFLENIPEDLDVFFRIPDSEEESRASRIFQNTFKNFIEDLISVDGSSALRCLTEGWRLDDKQHLVRLSSALGLPKLENLNEKIVEMNKDYTESLFPEEDEGDESDNDDKTA